jgi:hypothetical protein
MAQSNPEAAEKFLNDHLKKMSEITAAARLNKDSYAKVIEVRTADGKLETVSLMELLGNPQKYQPTEKGAPIVSQMTGGVTAENIRTVESGGRPDAVSSKGAQGVMQVMPNTQKDPGFGVAPAKDDSPEELQRVGEDYYAAMQKKYGNDTLAAIAYNMGPGATDDWLSKGGDFNKLPAETQSYIGKVYTANALASRQPAAPAAPVAPAGSVSGAARAREASEKEGSTAVAQALGKDFAATASAIDKAGLSAGDDYVLASEIVKLASDPTMKEMFGVLEKGGVAPFILRQMENAINAGQFGTFGVKGLADNLAKAGASPEQIAKYDRMIRNLATAELKYARVYLQGQGAVSDAERELIRNAVGAASKNPAKVLVMQGQIMQERAKFDADMSKAYDEYRNKYGSYADPSKFMRTEGRALIQRHNRDLANILGVDPAQTADNMPYKTGGTPGKGSDESKTPGGIKFKVVTPPKKS